MEDATATTNALTKKIAGLEEENVALKANVERLTQANAVINDTVKSLTGKNARLADELEDIRQLKKAKDSSETPLTLKVDAYTADLQVKAVQISVVKMINMLHAEVKSVNSKLASIDATKKSGAFARLFANPEGDV